MKLNEWIKECEKQRQFGLDEFVRENTDVLIKVVKIQAEALEKIAETTIGSKYCSPCDVAYDIATTAQAKVEELIEGE